MNIFNAGRRMGVLLVGMSLVMSVGSASAGSTVVAMQTTGGVRPHGGPTAVAEAGESLPNLRVTLRLHGKTYKTVPADITVTAADGKNVAAGTTSNDGTYLTSLEEGTYTIAARTDHYAATREVTIKESKTAAVRKISLRLKALPTEK